MDAPLSGATAISILAYAGEVEKGERAVAPFLALSCRCAEWLHDWLFTCKSPSPMGL